jgi:membrane protease YdiL (CAAX protease family)
MLAAIYMITRRLWAAIGLHAAWNFTQGGIYGIPVSGGAMDGVLRPDIRGSDLLTGGAFGAEASLPAIVVATAFGLAVIYVAWRRGQFIAPSWVRRSQGAAAQE